MTNNAHRGQGSEGIHCPLCDHQFSRALDSRQSASVANGKRRRRECVQCGTRFATVEIVQEEYDQLIRASSPETFRTFSDLGRKILALAERSA